MKKILIPLSIALLSEPGHTIGNMSIVVDFPDESLSASQRRIFNDAADRWGRMIQGAKELDFDYELRIEATGDYIDRAGGILGQAGPTHVWTDAETIPAQGSMSFDKYDLDDMEVKGTLDNVITHEMGHVIGIGTMWDHFLNTRDPQNPVYKGPVNSVAKGVYTRWTGSPIDLDIPIANTGGSGTYGGHWRESVFGDELMTGYLNLTTDSISILTLAALDDLGYAVNYSAAEPYSLPSMRELRAIKKETDARTLKRVSKTDTGNLKRLISPKSSESKRQKK